MPAPHGRPPTLYLTLQTEYSGAEITHVPLMRSDPGALLVCPPDSRTEQLAREAGIETAPLSYRPLRRSGGARQTIGSVFRGAASARDLRRVLRAHPERRLLYAVSIRPGLVATLAKPGLGRRAVWFVSDFMPPPPLGGLARALARMGCDRAVATSQAVARDFAGRSRRLRDRTTVVYPGVELERFDPGRATPGAPRAGVIGYLSAVKRTDLALEVARRVSAAEPGFELEVVGRAQYTEADFAYERELNERVRADGELGRCVSFVGYEPDVPGRLARLGLLLHCRPDEPFGIVLIEAMAAGVPVVAPDAAGPREIVDDGETGLLYEPGDADHAAELVLRLIRDPSEARRIAAAARAAVERRFTVEGQLAGLQAVVSEAGG
jgi:glycosyltransferase involved in cell wall biosynthesis